MTDGKFCVRRRWRALAFVALAALARPAAADSPAATPPSRIVSLVPAVTEILFALDLGPRVVGVSTYCDFPPEAAKLPKVGTFSEPVAEAIVALAPDLVLTSPSPGNEAAVRAIARTGVKVSVVHSEGGLEESLGAIREVAAAAGAGPKGEALVSSIEGRLEALRARAVGLPRPRVAVVIGREPLVLAGPASYLGEILTLVGGANVADAIGGRWPRVGLEFLVAAKPEVLIDLAAAMGETASAAEDPAAAWSELKSVPAVASGRVVVDRGSVMLRPGPRLADAAETLFVALHPEAGAGPAKAAAPASAEAD